MHNDGDKVLVFLHSVRLLCVLQYLFHGAISYLDGSLRYMDRQFVFLISTRAASGKAVRRSTM